MAGKLKIEGRCIRIPHLLNQQGQGVFCLTHPPLPLTPIEHPHGMAVGHDLHHRPHGLDCLPLAEVPAALLEELCEGPARAHLLDDIDIVIVLKHAHAAPREGERCQ